MTTQKDYRKTLRACYLGYVTQAICANFVPLLFLTFAADYGIPLERIALIPTVFFLTQLLVDLAAARFVDRLGYRPAMVLAHGTAAAGLALLWALVPLGNLFAFLRCPLARLMEEDQSLGIGRLLRPCFPWCWRRGCF